MLTTSWYLWPSIRSYKQYLANMNQLYTEGLLDSEYYTQNDAQMKAKGEAMRIGAYTYAAHFVLTGSTDPAVYDQYVVPEPLTSDVFTEKVWYGRIGRHHHILYFRQRESRDKRALFQRNI